MRLVNLALAIALVALAAFAASADAARYKVSFKGQGTFLRTNNPDANAPADHGNMLIKSSFSVSFGFGPVPLFDGHRHKKTDNTLKASGIWEEHEFRPSDPDSHCDAQGTFGAADFSVGATPANRPTVRTRGKKGATTISLGGGTSGPRVVAGNTGCAIYGGCQFGPPEFAGTCVIREVMSRADLKSPFFSASVRVTPASLRSHHGKFKVSNAAKAGEKVQPDCYFDAFEHPSCAYQWSGTVRIKKAR